MNSHQPIINQTVEFELHIAATVRNKYHIEGLLFGTNGSVIFSNYRTVRLLAYRINRDRLPRHHVYPGELNAAGLIEEVFHLIVRRYESEKASALFNKTHQWLQDNLNADSLRKLMLSFVIEFPSSDVYDKRLKCEDYLSMMTGSRHNTAITIEEMLMVYLAGYNPAGGKLKELFDTKYLPDSFSFLEAIEKLRSYLSLLPPFGPHDQDLFTMLTSPLHAAPDNYYAQLEWILENWSSLLPEDVLQLIRNGQDLMKEDLRLAQIAGPGPSPVPRYKPGQHGDASFIGKSRSDRALAGDYNEAERFTPDTDWMPDVVMLAKNTYVWLFQLSQQYNRPIARLDEVPDEELDRIASMNFNALWLIGVWERSPASQTIKHLCGNPDAVASAYSLYDYTIAAALGGEEAYQDLSNRASMRGIRLAGDMVPNHTGICSKWTYENPDFFIQNPFSPFPGYRFTGHNLSQNPDFEIRIEDGYYTRSDAAVVFQWVHKPSGHVRYIYHGNDGTMMPWNDTAQLDMLRAEVREAVINKIFEVAQRFSIIRFDAAMTLAKKHFARLWYPEPGSGGDIPSRADHAMTKEQFDDWFPVEFWREVVDRINLYKPQTLLLAEAFWLMEGYFVRTLGMHRVYNSAFMHMLKNEDNRNYRKLLANTLEFEPEILKRYVNFMSNPDEETAIRQFSTGDKYFGICTLMVTLPGLPMFAHGQTEGFTEKYGMEYQKAYMNEAVNQLLMEKHIKEIFPLTNRRTLFSDVEHFNLFDFHDDAGFVNENVYAFTNRKHNERALVLYNNKYETASGRIHNSVARLLKDTTGRYLAKLNLSEALDINSGDGVFYTFREHFSGMEFLRAGSEFVSNGWHWRLNGFEHRVFIDFTELNDSDGSLSLLNSMLQGRGVPSVATERRKQWLWPLHECVEELIDPVSVDFVSNAHVGQSDSDIPENMQAQIYKLYDEIKDRYHYFSSEPDLKNAIKISLQRLIRAGRFVQHPGKNIEKLLKSLNSGHLPSLMYGNPNRPAGEEGALFLMAFIIIMINNGFKNSNVKSEPFDELMLSLPFASILARYGRTLNDVQKELELLKAISRYKPALCSFDKHQNETYSSGSEDTLLCCASAHWWDDPQIKMVIGINTWEGATWFNEESFNQFCLWMFRLAVIEACSVHNSDKTLDQTILLLIKQYNSTLEAARQAGYNFDTFIQKLEDKF